MTSKNVVATIREDAPFVPAGRYYLFSEPAAWTLMPTDEGSGQLPLTLDKGAYTLTADAAPTEPDEMQGMLRVYKLRPIALSLTDSSGNHAALSVSYGADNLAVLQSWGFDCRRAGEPTDKPAETFTAAVKNGGGLLPKGKLEVWRDGDALRFFRRDKGLYTGKGSLQIGELPIRLIRFYRLCGGIRTETRVSGGGVSVDREAAYWSQWEHPFSLNPLVSSAVLIPLLLPRSWLLLLRRLAWRRTTSYSAAVRLSTVIPLRLALRSLRSWTSRRFPTLPVSRRMATRLLLSVCSRTAT